MNIQVCYPDNRFDYVSDNILDRLIESRRIVKFRRSSGWVTLGVDPIRSIGDKRESSWRDRKKSISDSTA
jgi:hypothetical protein